MEDAEEEAAALENGPAVNGFIKADDGAAAGRAGVTSESRSTSDEFWPRKFWAAWFFGCLVVEMLDGDPVALFEPLVGWSVDHGLSWPAAAGKDG